ncbi:MAG: DUF3108 domain-containing protein [Chlorobi bacterium]|nr:DUF3108 domain-containing protein [Chlorobiota bacterium]
MPWNTGGRRFVDRLFLFLTLAALPGSVLPAAGEDTLRVPEGLFQLGEELVYEVSYLFIDLGTITARVVAIDTVGENVYYKMDCTIQSYKGVPFVSLLTIFESTMDQHLRSVSFSAREPVKDTTWKYITYTYDFSRDVVYIMDRIGDRIVKERVDTVALNKRAYQDGLSILYFARACAGRTFSLDVPTLIYHDTSFTRINFGRGRSSVNIEAVDYPVDVVMVDGEAGFTGIFGLTGGFRGWFSNDAAHVPIFAKLHVLIGNVNVELIQWNRKDWTPPKYNEEK